MKFLILLLLTTLFSLNNVYSEYVDVPGQFGLDGYIQIMREGIPQKIHNKIYDGNGKQIINFKDFIPADLGNQMSKSKNLEYIELKYQTMLRVLKEKDGETPRFIKLNKILTEHWSEIVILFPLIKSNEGSYEKNNPGNNNQGLYQLYGYEQYRKGGCIGDSGFYTTCPGANVLYQAGKELSEYEQYQQLADFIMFLSNKMRSIDGKILGQGALSIAQNLNFVFQSLGLQTDLNECSKLVNSFNKKDLTLPANQVAIDFFIKNQLELTKIGVSNVEGVSKIITMYYLSSRLLSYNGFRFGTNYLDNPYIASLYSPKSGDPRICMSQCANDGCSKKNIKKGNGAIYFYYGLTEDGVGKKIFVNIMQSLKENGQLNNSVSCP